MADGVVDRLVLEVVYDYDERGEKQVRSGFAALVGLATAASAAMLAATLEAAAAGDQAAKLGRELGLTSAEFGALAFAAERSGIGIDVLRPAAATLTRQIGAAARGSEEATRAFRALGLEGELTAGHMDDPIQAIGLIGDALDRAGYSAEAKAAALALLGEGGSRMASLLEGGSAGVEALRARFEELGGAIEPVESRLAEDFQDKLTDLRVLSVGLSRDLGFALLPSLDRVAGGLLDVGIAMRPALSAGLERLGAIVGDPLANAAPLLGAAALGVTSLAAAGAALKAVGLGPMLAKVGAGIAVIAWPVAVGAAFVAVLDDLVVAAQGGDSAILDLAASLGVESELQWALSAVGPLLSSAGSAASAFGSYIIGAAGDAITAAAKFLGLEEALRSLWDWLSGLDLSGMLGGAIESIGDTMAEATQGFDKARLYLEGDPRVARRLTGGDALMMRLGEVDPGRALYEYAAGGLPEYQRSVTGETRRVGGVQVDVTIGASAEAVAREAARKVEQQVLAGMQAADGGIQ